MDLAGSSVDSLNKQMTQQSNGMKPTFNKITGADATLTNNSFMNTGNQNIFLNPKHMNN
jgi:hypothetical protein